MAAPDFFGGGGIEGTKCDSEGGGQKSKKLPKIADSGHFFLRGQVGGRASDGGQMPPCPP